MIVGIDSMVVIYGMRAARKSRGTPADKTLTDLRRRATVLLETLSETGDTILLPSIAAAEILTGIEVKDHGNFLAELQERFLIPPFNVRASQFAAQLWQRHRALPKEEQIARTTLKSDAMIVATAKVSGAGAFYSHETKVRKLADLAGMVGKDLPTHSEDLFVDAESRKAAEDDDRTGKP